MCFVSLHNHTDFSNLRLIDCTNSVDELILTSAKMGYKGLAITEHESVSSSVKAIQTTRKLKEANKIPNDFKLILGNEIYLCDSLEEVRDNYKSGETKFPHFLLISKNKKGHEQLRYLSSLAWKNSFFTGTMERTPTLKIDLERVVRENPNNLIATTACLGSECSIHLLNIKEAEETKNQNKADFHRHKLDKFIKWCIDVFGKNNFFVELQPAISNEQRYVNEKLVSIARHYDLKLVITTDTHYLRPEDRVVHKAFLNAKDGDREVDSFYMDTYLHTIDEIKNKTEYLPPEIIQEAINNTLLIGEMVEDYTIEHETVIPKIDLPEFEVSHMFKKAYDQYDYIKKMAYAENEQDRYILKLIEEGFKEHIPYSTLTREKFHIILNRINLELGELWEISQNINQAMSSYYVTVREIVNIIWDDECGGDSLVGSGRGSASGFLINLLLGITQINPLEYGIEMPHWRHLHKSRPDVSALDIDIDTESSKRPKIIQALKNHFGENRILQVCTFGTEKSKSALQTACRGLGIDSDVSLHLSSMIPFERGSNWTLKECLYGDEESGKKPIKELIRELEKYPNLQETALKIEGKINKRSIHAGGVVLFNEDYYKSNALMTAPNGLPVTQFNLDDSQSVGNIKFDLLTIEALDKIRVTLDTLLEHNEIEWQGSIRKTFDKYLHPSNIDIENPRLYEMLGNGEVLDLFQFSTDVGYQAALKVKPKNLLETAAANSLMRLMSDGDDQPIDTFIKYKNNISLWYDEMERYGLSESEVKIMEEYLLKLSGVADTQEVVMLMTMDERISGFDVAWANKTRKAIAKRSKEALDEVYSKFFEQGKELGNSDQILKYVWEVQIKRMLGYAFSVLHTICYSVIALQELNLNLQYDPLYWQTACLSVNSGGQEVEDENAKQRTTEYGKVASAIGNMRQNGVRIALPDINRAKFGFSPDLENNEIIFGLKGINGIGDEAVHTIIANRPYSSFNNFIEKVFDQGLMKKGHVIQLIKAGAFDKLGDRAEVMKEFISKIADTKSKLTTANIPMLIEHNLIPDELSLEKRLFNFNKFIGKCVHKTTSKPKDKLLYLSEGAASDFYNENFSDEHIVDMVDNQLIISQKSFKKEYDKKIEQIKTWLKEDDVLDALNKSLIEEEFNKYAVGGCSKWEMDSVSFYYHDHELSHVNKEKYGVDNYFDLPEDPVVIDTYKHRGREINVFDTTRIVGTVLDKDKNKHSITLLTPDGVVTVKLYSGAFSHYSRQLSVVGEDGKKTVIEKSWFTRGNKLLISGYRRGNKFTPKVYNNSIYSHTVCLIEDIDSKGNLTLKTEREHV